jgi:hypothetical protein
MDSRGWSWRSLPAKAWLLALACSSAWGVWSAAGGLFAEAEFAASSQHDEREPWANDGLLARWAPHRFPARRDAGMAVVPPSHRWRSEPILRAGTVAVVQRSTPGTSARAPHPTAQMAQAAAGTRPPSAQSRATEPWKRLENRQIGYVLLYPTDWSVGGQVAATEFAVGGQCQSVRVVDFEPTPGSGPGAQIRQSFVQVCAKRIAGADSLPDFMHRTYGAQSTRTFEMARLNGLSVYRTRNKEEQTTRMLFADIGDQRVQVYGSVVAGVADIATRTAQVADILASFAAI